jgi:integrase
VLKYKPSRDIPKAIKEMKTLSPSKIVEWIREHRTERDARGKRVQVNKTPESVTMWLNRHAKMYAKLKAEIENEELTKVAISESLFENGAFRKIPCIEKWILQYKARGGKDATLTRWLSIIKRVCQGQLPYGKQIEEWGLKHPRFLTLEDSMRYIVEAEKTGASIREFRLALRNFLKSKNVEDWDTISGRIEKQAGQYAHLYAPKDKMDGIFAWLKSMNQEAHDACYFAFKTACRKTATLEAHAKYFDKEQMIITVFEKASRNSPKRRMEKVITPELWDILEHRVERGGKLFDIQDHELNAILRACYNEVIPKLAKEIPMPFHFFRHQFAQHMLRATGWNYGLVARLGGWTVGTLERYYGKMDRQSVFNEARKYLPTI